MIIIDLSHIMISNVLNQMGTNSSALIEENMIRHTIVNSIRSIKMKYYYDYGEVVIACDNQNYWRKDIFPYYKANRKKNRDQSKLDWKVIFEYMNKIKDELKTYFPYKIIDIPRTEADDIVSTLVQNNKNIPIIIISSDKDFIQLHTLTNVKQYDIIRDKWIRDDNPEEYLKEHILKGDSGDGIPNILSSDNCFVIGERQKSLTKKKIEELLNKRIEEYDAITYKNYMRNQSLIDLKCIPSDIQEKILYEYENQIVNKGKLIEYFMKFKLRNLYEHLSDF